MAVAALRTDSIVLEHSSSLVSFLLSATIYLIAPGLHPALPALLTHIYKYLRHVHLAGLWSPQINAVNV